MKITYELPCSNEFADEWGDVILSYDDSGDREVSVGIVAAMSECERSDKKREFTQEIHLSTQGYIGCEEQFSPHHLGKIGVGA